MQYFYLVSHTDSNNIRTNDKIFLQEEKAVNWGRKQATKFPELDYWLQRCPITSSGKIQEFKSLLPFKSNKLEAPLPTVNLNWNEIC